MNHDSPTFVDVDKLGQSFDFPSHKQISETNSMSGDGEKEDDGDSSDRGKDFCFPELMCCLFSCLGTNEQFSAANQLCFTKTFLQFPS